MNYVDRRAGLVKKTSHPCNEAGLRFDGLFARLSRLKGPADEVQAFDHFGAVVR